MTTDPRSPTQYDAPLEAARLSLGMTPCGFGVAFFGYAAFQKQVRTTKRLQSATATRIGNFLQRYDRGEFDHLRREPRP